MLCPVVIPCPVLCPVAIPCPVPHALLLYLFLPLRESQNVHMLRQTCQFDVLERPEAGDKLHKKSKISVIYNNGIYVGTETCWRKYDNTCGTRQWRSKYWDGGHAHGSADGMLGMLSVLRSSLSSRDERASSSVATTQTIFTVGFVLKTGVVSGADPMSNVSLMLFPGRTELLTLVKPGSTAGRTHSQ